MLTQFIMHAYLAQSVDSGAGGGSEIVTIVYILTGISLIVGFIVAFAMLFTEFTLHPPVWVHLVVWMPLTAVLCLGLMRPFKAIMIALQFHNHASQARNDD